MAKPKEEILSYVKTPVETIKKIFISELIYFSILDQREIKIFLIVSTGVLTYERISSLGFAI